MIDPARVQEVFLKVIERPEAERDSVLAVECGSDEELRLRVLELVLAHDSSGEFLDHTSNLGAKRQQIKDDSELNMTQDSERANGSDAQTANFQPGIEPGRVINERYTLQQKIGEGGMGDVWVAKQSKPIKRKVALKVIKTGMDSRAVLERFDQERQALAMMDHPNIARVLDAGMTQTGQPYFVMELVKGLPLNKFCDESKLALDERLELFVPICQAVQHAHQKGIIHRDLKPANILVTMVDGEPVPKVIDFGVAKATGGKLTDQTIETQFGAVVGTLEYMSPEQAGISAVDVDTRADIYSLGVILYELLTGLRPIDAQRLRKAGLAEMMRIIKEEEPSKPSTKLSTDDSLPSLAAVRQTDPKKLVSILRGELDWIVLKCLEKSRERRYESANGLAREIERYLNDEPVEAKPPSMSYRFTKFARRNKGSLVAASFVLAALIVGIIGTTYGLFEAKRQTKIAQQSERESNANEALAIKNEERAIKNEKLAFDRLGESQQARLDEQKAREKAELRSSQLERSNELLGDIFVDLNPKEIKESNEPLEAILAKRLRRVADQLTSESVGDDEVAASLQFKLARALGALGYHQDEVTLRQRGLTHLRKTRGNRDPDTINAIWRLGSSFTNLGEGAKAVELLEEAAQLAKRHLDDDDDARVGITKSLGVAYERSNNQERAMQYLRLALAMSRDLSGEDADLTTECKWALCQTLAGTKQFDEAIPMAEDVAARMSRDPNPKSKRPARGAIALAGVYIDSNQPEKAIGLLLKSLPDIKNRTGRGSSQAASAIHLLAKAYTQTGQHDDAISLLKEGVETLESLGITGRPVVVMTRTLAGAYSNKGDFKEQYKLLKRMNVERRPYFARDPEMRMHHLIEFGGACRSIGKNREAIDTLEQARQLGIKLGYQDRFEFSVILNELGRSLMVAHDFQRALECFRTSIEINRKKLSPTHRYLFGVRCNRARALMKLGRFKEACEVYDAVLEIQRTIPKERKPNFALTWQLYSQALRDAGQTDEAIEYVKKAIAELHQRYGNDNQPMAVTRSHYASMLIAKDELSRAQEELDLARPPLFKTYDEKHPARLWWSTLDAIVKRESGEPQAAIDILEEALASVSQSSRPQILDAAEELILSQLAAGKLKNAETSARKYYTMCKEAAEKEPNIFGSSLARLQSILGRVLVAREEYKEAVPLLIEAHEKLEAIDATTAFALRDRLPKCARALVEIYEATGDEANLAKWKLKKTP